MTDRKKLLGWLFCWPAARSKYQHQQSHSLYKDGHGDTRTHTGKMIWSQAGQEKGDLYRIGSVIHTIAMFTLPSVESI